MSTAQRSVIIDNGSSTIKCGYGGDDKPYSVFPSIIGRPWLPSNAMPTPFEALIHKKTNNISFGYVAKNNKLTKITHPIKNGIITNWDDMVCTI